MKRIIFLLATVAAVTIALPGAAALAQEEGDRGGGDVCVSVKGDTKVDRGDSECSSDETSRAVAIRTAMRSRSRIAARRPSTTARRGGELVRGGIHPPALQKAEPDYDGKRYQDVQDSDGCE